MMHIRAFLFCIGISISSVFAEKQPNVLIIDADDIGRGDLSCWGQEHFSTPNIDSPANETRRRTYRAALYNLKDDPCEKVDIAAEHPEKVPELEALMEQAKKPLP